MNILVQKCHGNYKCVVVTKDDDPPPPPSFLHSCQRKILIKVVENFFINRSKIHKVLSFLRKDKLTHVLDIDRIFYKYIKTLLIAAN